MILRAEIEEIGRAHLTNTVRRLGIVGVSREMIYGYNLTFFLASCLRRAQEPELAMRLRNEDELEKWVKEEVEKYVSARLYEMKAAVS